MNIIVGSKYSFALEILNSTNELLSSRADEVSKLRPYQNQLLEVELGGTKPLKDILPGIVSYYYIYDKGFLKHKHRYRELFG